MAKITIEDACYRPRFGPSDLPAAGPVSFEVGEQEFVALVGPDRNGAATLLRMIAGLEPPSSGRIMVDGTPPSAPERRASLVFRMPLLFDWRSVIGNVLLQGRFYRLDPAEAQVRARRLLAAAGLAHAIEGRCHELPPADRRRVAFCRALIHEPDVLLLDDPLHGLDSISLANLAGDLQRLLLARPLAVVLVTSQVTEAVLLSDRILVTSRVPCRITDSVRINLPRPRRLDRETTPPIADYCSRVRTALQAAGVLA
jgi:NitT/TauT family transport system ATP-binding protein